MSITRESSEICGPAKSVPWSTVWLYPSHQHVGGSDDLVLWDAALALVVSWRPSQAGRNKKLAWACLLLHHTLSRRCPRGLNVQAPIGSPTPPEGRTVPATWQPSRSGTIRHGHSWRRSRRPDVRRRGREAGTPDPRPGTRRPGRQENLDIRGRPVQLHQPVGRSRRLSVWKYRR